MRLNRVLIIAVLSFVGLSSNAMEASLKEIAMPGGGDCLFWSLTASEVNQYDWHKKVHRDRARSLKASTISALDSGSYDEKLMLFLASDENVYRTKQAYIAALKRGTLLPGELELSIAGDILQTNVVVHMLDGQTIAYPHNLSYPNTTHVLYYPGHYNYLEQS